MSEPVRELSDLGSVFVALRPALEQFIARRVRCPQLSQDLASEMYVRLAQVAFSGTHEEARRYLYRMASNIAIDHIKVQKRRVAIIDENLVHFETYTPSPEPALLAREALGIVADAIEGLPDKAREILYLSRSEGLTHAEIAARFGISKSMIEKYIIRSVRHCRDKLREASELPACEPAVDEAAPRRVGRPEG